MWVSQMNGIVTNEISKYISEIWKCVHSLVYKLNIHIYKLFYIFDLNFFPIGFPTFKCLYTEIILSTVA